MARKPARRPRVSKITIPARCHAAVKVVFAEMQRQAITYDELEYRSGVLKSTFKAWRTNNRPGLETVEAALGALGWAFLPVPSISQLPATVRAKLDEAAAEWGDVNPLLCELLARVCGVKVRAQDELSEAAAAKLDEFAQREESAQLRKSLAASERREALSDRRAQEDRQSSEMEKQALSAELDRLKAQLRHFQTKVRPALEAEIKKRADQRGVFRPFTDHIERQAFYNWRYRTRSKRNRAHG